MNPAHQGHICAIIFSYISCLLYFCISINFSIQIRADGRVENTSPMLMADNGFTMNIWVASNQYSGRRERRITPDE